MPQPGVFIAPIIGTVVVGVIVLALAIWCAAAFTRSRFAMARYRSALARANSAAYRELQQQSVRADDALVDVINIIEANPGLFSQEAQQKIFDAHSSFRRIEGRT